MNNLLSLAYLGSLLAVTIGLTQFVQIKPDWYRAPISVSAQESHMATPTSVLPWPDAPAVTAKAYYVRKIGTTQPLLEHNGEVAYPPASTTKMMTALVALDTYKLKQDLVIPKVTTEGVQVGLEPGETMTVENLLYAMMLVSGNDIAVILAQAHPQGMDGFIAAMNSKTKKLGLKETNFVNPTGLDQPGQLSSARDLAVIAEFGLRNPVFAQIVSSADVTVLSDQLQAYPLANRNELLSEEGVTGVKTGYTEEAGEVLVTSWEHDGDIYLIVVMGSDDRFNDTRKFIDWLREGLGVNKAQP